METGTFTRHAPASAFLVTALVLGTVANGCRREPSMASKSAAAYREAVDQGLPMGSGHGGHGGGESGHSGMAMPEDGAVPEHGHADAEEHPAKASDGSASAAGTHHSDPAEVATPMATADHSGHASGAPSPITGVSHSNPAATPADSLPGMDHPKAGKPGSAAPMAGMDHSQPVGGKPGTVTEMTGMDHSQPAGGAADPMAGMDHAAMGHGSPAPIPQSRPAPTSSSQIGQLDPIGTLSPDEFDRTVAPPSNAGSVASGQATEHQGHDVPGPISASPKGAAAPDPVEAAFTCPMHPEVRSSQPGTCPKCGMTLVKKEKP